MKKKKSERLLLQIQSKKLPKSLSKKTDLSAQRRLNKPLVLRHIRIQQQNIQQKEKSNQNLVERKQRHKKHKKTQTSAALQKLMKKYDVIDFQHKDPSQISLPVQKKDFSPRDLQNTESGTIYNEEQYNLYYSTQINFDRQLSKLCKKIDCLKSKSKSRAKKLTRSRKPIERMSQRLIALQKQQKQRKYERQHLSLNQKQSYRLTKIHYIQRLEAQKLCQQIRNCISLSPLNKLK